MISRNCYKLISSVFNLCTFCLQANALTYATIGFFAIYLGYNIPRIWWYTRAPEPVASDFKKYDRATKKLVD